MDGRTVQGGGLIVVADPTPHDRGRISALHTIRDSIPGTTGKVQQMRLLAAIQSLGSVTTFEAMRHLDVFDPRPRKLELVRAGHPIQLAWDRIETEAGVVHRIGRYFMSRRSSEEVATC